MDKKEKWWCGLGHSNGKEPKFQLSEWDRTTKKNKKNSLSNDVKLIVCNRRTPKCDHVIR